MTWLTDNLKQRIREVFEPRYKRCLTDQEVIEIANNLTGSVGIILRKEIILKRI